jgi:hypothetical protein
VPASFSSPATATTKIGRVISAIDWERTVRAITLTRKSFWALAPFVALGWVLGAAGSPGAAVAVIAVGLVLCPFANLISGEPPVVDGAKRVAAGLKAPAKAQRRPTDKQIARAVAHEVARDIMVRQIVPSMREKCYFMGASRGCAGCKAKTPHGCRIFTGMEDERLNPQVR